jgi:Na+/proline symporter
MQLSTALVIVTLALAVWLFFYVESMPLESMGTVVVVGVCAAIVFAGKWLWKRLYKHSSRR